MIRRAHPLRPSRPLSHDNAGAVQHSLSTVAEAGIESLKTSARPYAPIWAYIKVNDAMTTESTNPSMIQRLRKATHRTNLSIASIYLSFILSISE